MQVNRLFAAAVGAAFLLVIPAFSQGAPARRGPAPREEEQVARNAPSDRFDKLSADLNRLEDQMKAMRQSLVQLRDDLQQRMNPRAQTSARETRPAPAAEERGTGMRGMMQDMRDRFGSGAGRDGVGAGRDGVAPGRGGMAQGRDGFGPGRDGAGQGRDGMAQGPGGFGRGMGGPMGGMGPMGMGRGQMGMNRDGMAQRDQARPADRTAAPQTAARRLREVLADTGRKLTALGESFDGRPVDLAQKAREIFREQERKLEDFLQAAPAAQDRRAPAPQDNAGPRGRGDGAQAGPGRGPGGPGGFGGRGGGPGGFGGRGGGPGGRGGPGGGR